MRYIEAFSKNNESWFSRTGRHEFAIYLAGSISEFDNWQQKFVTHFENLQGENLLHSFRHKNLTVINPVRKEVNLKRSETKKQIMWESSHAKAADALVFFFSVGSDCSVSLYLYGKYLVSGKKIFVAIDKEHEKMLEIFAHTRIEKPDQNINYSLESLIEEVEHYIEGD